MYYVSYSLLWHPSLIALAQEIGICTITCKGAFLYISIVKLTPAVDQYIA